MKSLDFKQVARYLIGIILLLLPLLPLRQGDGLGPQHLQLPHVKVPDIAEGQHGAVWHHVVWQQGCQLDYSPAEYPD